MQINFPLLQRCCHICTHTWCVCVARVNMKDLYGCVVSFPPPQCKAHLSTLKYADKTVQKSSSVTVNTFSPTDNLSKEKKIFSHSAGSNLSSNPPFPSVCVDVLSCSMCWQQSGCHTSSLQQTQFALCLSFPLHSQHFLELRVKH